MKAAEKKLVGSTGSPLGKAGERCEGGGVGDGGLAHWKIQISSGGIRSAVDRILTCVSSCSAMACSERKEGVSDAGGLAHMYINARCWVWEDITWK